MALHAAMNDVPHSFTVSSASGSTCGVWGGVDINLNRVLRVSLIKVLTCLSRRIINRLINQSLIVAMFPRIIHDDGFK